MKKLILSIGCVFLFSCGSTIKDISFETGDYLGTGYDDKLQKPTKKENTTKSQTIKEEKKSFLSTLSSAVISDSDEEEDLSDIYEKSVNLPYDELDLLLRTELENNNFKIIHVLNITAGVEEQGVMDFWKHMHIYLVCKLSECSKIMKHNPQLASQFPLRIYTYEKDGKMIVGMFKPSTAIKYMGNLDAEGIKALKTLDKELKKVIDKLTK